MRGVCNLCKGGGLKGGGRVVSGKLHLAKH